MSPEQIKVFFSRAEIVSSEVAHMYFDWGGCDIEGDLLLEENKFHFYINAGGSAVIQIRGEEEEVHFGCKETCADIFDFGFYTSMRSNDG